MRVLTEIERRRSFERLRGATRDRNLEGVRDDYRQRSKQPHKLQ